MEDIIKDAVKSTRRLNQRQRSEEKKGRVKEKHCNKGKGWEQQERKTIFDSRSDGRKVIVKNTGIHDEDDKERKRETNAVKSLTSCALWRHSNGRPRPVPGARWSPSTHTAVAGCSPGPFPGLWCRQPCRAPCQASKETEREEKNLCLSKQEFTKRNKDTDLQTNSNPLSLSHSLSLSLALALSFSLSPCNFNGQLIVARRTQPQ